MKAHHQSTTAFSPTQKLEVWRTFAHGQETLLGLLAQNRNGVYFQLDTNYQRHHANVSPFQLHWDTTLQLAPKQPHQGLPGVFADSLPDGWGLLLMDRAIRQYGISPNQFTAMDRLAFVGDSGMGAFSYRPHSFYALSPDDAVVDLTELGSQAQAIFDGQTDEVWHHLIAAGSSGGARPKAQIYFAPNQPQLCRTTPQTGDEAWLVKFTTSHLGIGHEEGLCEAVYLTLAQQAGLDVPQWQLIPATKDSPASHWLALKRFDRVNLSNGMLGKIHMHSACGLLDADFRSPSLDYDDLIKASSILCQSPQAGQIQFQRAMFNLLACNQDDHSKNWAFLQNDQGQWQLAPFYDVTFSPHPFGEHTTAYGGYGKNPPIKVLQKLATSANYTAWSKAKQAIERIQDSLSQFDPIAKSFGISHATRQTIQAQLNQQSARFLSGKP